MSGNYEGVDDVLALFKIKDKVYVLELTSEDRDLSIDNMRKITKTGKVKQ